LGLQTQLYKIVMIATQNKEKLTNKITIKCQITIGMTNSQRVRGVMSTQYSLKRECFSSPV